MTPVAEKIKRIVRDYTNFIVWSSEGNFWANNDILWSADTDNYYWHNMQVNISYNPDRTELEEAEGKGLSIIEFELTFNIEEVYN